MKLFFRKSILYFSSLLFLFSLIPGNEITANSTGHKIDNQNTGKNPAFNIGSCAVDSINVSTGWNYNTNTTYNNLNNDQDVYWRLVGAPMNNGTVNLNGPGWVIEKHSVWSNPVSGSQWISAFDTADMNLSYNQTPFAFQKKILVNNTTNLTFNLKVLVDNFVDVKLVDGSGNLVSLLGSLQGSSSYFGNYFTSYSTIDTIVNSISAGTYYLRLEVNNDNTSGATGVDIQGYVKGSSGTLTLQSCFNTSLSSVSGFKYHDFNINGVWDTNEEVLSGWQINLNGNGITKSAKTDMNGYYVFNDLPAGIYTVSEVAQDGWTSGPAGTSQLVNVSTNAAVPKVNFGNHQEDKLGSICGIKFNDINGNGNQDNGEPGLENWVINLTYENAAGHTTFSTATDGKGNFCFDSLKSGTPYTISEVNQRGWTQTYPSFPGTYTITLTSGQNIDTLKFGNHENPLPTDTCSVDSLIISTGWNYNTNTTYNNLGNDQDPFWTLVNAPTNNGPVNLNGPVWVIPKNPTGWSDPMTGSQWISAFDTLGSNLANTGASDTPYVFQKSICVNSATNLTYNLNVLVDNYVTIKFVDSNGNLINQIGVLNVSQTHYFSNPPNNFTGTIPNVAPGIYYLWFEVRNDNSGSAMGLDVQGSIKGASSTLINTLCCGTTGSSITGYKFNDLNNNGLKDANEQFLPGWQINLTGNGTNQSSTTDANGNYLFTSLSAGTYTVSEVAQNGWVAGPTGPQQTVNIGEIQAINNVNFGNYFDTTAVDVCDSLNATASKTNASDCSWSLSLLQPSDLSGIFAIQITSLSPNQFTIGTGLGANYQDWSASGNTYFPPTSNYQVPPGNLNDFFDMNILYSTSPQFVVVSWLDSSDNKICSDTLQLDCQVSCTTSSEDTLICNGNGDYTFSYKFTNNANYGISMVVYNLQEQNGATVSPDTTEISPEVAAGAASSTQTIHVTGGIPGDTLHLTAKYISSGGCCWCFETFELILPGCNSVCDSLGVSVSGSETDCCYTVSLTNNSSMTFSRVDFQILSGGMFSNFSTVSAPGWLLQNISPNDLIQLKKRYGQQIGSGTFNDVLDMCIRHYPDSNQVVEVKWIKDGEVICRDTLRFNCISLETSTDTCSQVIDGTMTCLANGTVQYIFRIQNNSAIIANGFGIFPMTPGLAFSKTIFTDVNIQPGQVSPLDTIIISGIGVDRQVCLQTSVFVLVDSLYDICCHSDTVCFIAPNCGVKDSAEACIRWSLFSDESVTSIIGNITGAPEYLSPGSSAPLMGILTPYTSDGERLLVYGGWQAGNTDINRYIEFKVSPDPGKSFTINNISFNFGDNPAPANFNIIKSQVFYSTDGFTNHNIGIGGTLNYLNSSMMNFSITNLGVSVSNGQTFSLRIYPYSPTGSKVGTLSLAIHNNVEICGTTSSITGVEDTKQVIIPKNYSLYQNYPNPFNPTSIIQYDIPKNSFVLLKVYDILGREVKTLVNKEQSPGRYNVTFDAAQFTSGIYFYSLRAGNFYQIKKMMLLK